MKMELVGVRSEMRTNQPIVLLRELEGAGRVLPIFIGGSEATAISLSLDGVTPPRPMTHDLFLQTLEMVGATIDKVTITRLEDKTFYAELTVVADKNTYTVSARPSDSLALAVRDQIPIFVDPAVLDEAAYQEDRDAEDDDQTVEEFREFLDGISPEDFESTE